jgi:tetratricopeptide (TPR) repeat protein
MPTRRPSWFLLSISLLFLSPALALAAPRAKGTGRKPPPAAAASPAPAAAATTSAAARVQATSLMRQGNDALRQGLYLDALKLFQQAYALFPSPRLHFNVAQVYHELGRPLEALDHYERFTAEVKKADGPEQWDIAFERAFRLRGAIVTIEVQTNVPGALVTVDGRPAGRTPLGRPVRLLPGPHAVVVTKDGYAKQLLEISLRAGDSATRLVRLLTEEEAVANQRLVQRLAEERRTAQERLQRAQAEEQRRRRRSTRTLTAAGWTSLGLGVAGLAAGGTCAYLSQREARKVEDARLTGAYWHEVSGAYDRSKTYRVASYVGLATGGALAITGGVLLVVARRGAERAPVAPARTAGVTGAAPAVGPGGAGLVVTGRF